MAELVAVQSGFALFRTGDVGVIIDTNDLNPYDPQPLQTILASGTWSTDVADADVPPACQELAAVALESYESGVTLTASVNDSRVVRVPKKVQDAVRVGLEALRQDTSVAVPLVAAGIADKLLSGSITIGQVKRIHAHARLGASQPNAAATQLIYGGDAGREWAARVCGDVPLTAAAPSPDDPTLETEWTDPAKPHPYVELAPEDTTCALCNLPATAPVHEAAASDAPASNSTDGSSSQVEYFATFAPGGNEGPVVRVDSILARDESGAWWIREFGEWVPTQAPDEDADIVMLDAESLEAATKQLDEPGAEYAELSLSEERLFQLAIPELDFGTLDAVFATTPFIPTHVRSENAKKQLRDAKGQFIVQGGVVEDARGDRGTIARVDGDAGTVEIKGADGQTRVIPANEVTVDRNADGKPDAAAKARLDQPVTVVTDVPGLIAKYQAQWAQEKKTEPVTAAGDPLIPPDEPAPASATPTASGPSVPVDPAQDDAGQPGGDPVAEAGVTPLYLAEVDKMDTQAVLELVAVIPSSGQGDPIDVYKRDRGAWVRDDALRQSIQGPTPPPLVELTTDMYTNVLQQMDSHPTEAPVAAAGYAVLQQFTASADGLTASQVRGARLLAPYGEELPTDVIQHLDELAEGGADKNRGNAERLRHYWVYGEGAQKIRWGVPGDYMRCVGLLSRHLGPRAYGYCQLRHKDATGFYAGHAPTEQRPHAKVAALVGEVQTDVLAAFEALDPDRPHEFNGPGPESDLFDGECGLCGRPIDHAIHVVVEEAANVPASTDTEDVDFSVPHVYVPAAGADDDPEGDGDVIPAPACECGRPADDPMHVVAAAGPPTVLADSAATVVPGQRFRIPLLVPEGVESGDGRTFAQGSLTSRDMPLALMWQPEGDEGHKGAVIVGRIDHVERTEEGLGNAYGVFDTGEHGQEALRLVRAGMLRGISADLDEFEATVMDGDKDENKVTSTKLMVNKGRLMGATLVAKPAYAQCVIELVNEGETTVADGEYTQETGEARVAALIASAAPLVPPKSWFENPRLTKPTHLTVDDDGRVYGHIAAWDVDHIGLPFGTRAPRSVSNYAYFRTGVIRTAEGDDVPVGQLTLAGGHAPLKADAREAVKHYDDTASAVADLAAGEDAYGIWVAGALRPGVTPEQVRALRASSPSGDWRPIRGSLELVAVCQVNVPGFPVARAMVASGVVTALVAAGCLVPEATEAPMSDINARIAALEAAEQRRLDAAARAARERIDPVRTAKYEALTAAADSARTRVDAVRQERQARLEAKKAELVTRLVAAGLHPAPDFDEEKHPRDEDGRFRTVLARLHALLNDADAPSVPRGGVERIEDAAGKEEAGDVEGAAHAAEEGAVALDAAAAEATGDAQAKLRDVASQVRAAADAVKNGPSAGIPAPLADAVDEAGDVAEVLFEELTEEAKALILEAVDRAEQRLDPANPEEMLQKLKAFITGTNAMDPNDVANFVKNQLKRPFTPEPPTVAPQGPTAQPSVPSPV